MVALDHHEYSVQINDDGTLTLHEPWNSENNEIFTVKKILGVEKTNIDLEISGYQITTKDKSVFMYVNHVYGYQQVALSFLKNVLGYDRISNEIVLFKRDVSTLPEIDIVEIPDFQTRTMNDYASNNYYYETGYIQMTEVMYSNSKRGIDFTHNSMQYVSKEKNIICRQKSIL